MAKTMLGKAINLGEGRSIQPPEGWEISGVLAENPLLLLPKSRLIIRPPDQSKATICWRIVSWLVGAPEADDFLSVLMNRKRLSAEDLEPLYPNLVKILLGNITQASVHGLPGAGNVLSLSYLDSATGWAGHVIYAPTLEVKGEVQILSYEGPELDYVAHLPEAMESLKSFRDQRLL